MGRTTRHSAAHCSSALSRDFFYHRCVITVEQCLCEIEVKMCLGSFIAVPEVAQVRFACLLLFLPLLISALSAFAALPFCLGRIPENRSFRTPVVRSHLQAAAGHSIN